MSANAIAWKAYRVPTAYAEASVSLDEFSTEDIRAYLEHIDGGTGTNLSPEGALTISSDDMSRIATLSLCGQKQAARDELLQIVSRHIGRTL